MGNITMNGQTIFEQVGTNRPTTGAGFPAGHVIQVQCYTQTDLTTSTTLLRQYVVGMTGTITTKESNSKIIVMADARGYATGTVDGLNIAIKQNNNDILITNRNETWTSGVTGNGLSGGGDTWIGMYNGTGLATYSWSITRIAEDDPQVTSGTVMSYSVMFGKWASGGTVYFGYDANYSQSNRLLIMEVSQ